MYDQLPVFPDIPCTSITRTRFYPIIDEDLKSEEDIETLAVQMFQDAEADFYYYQAKGVPQNPILENNHDLTWSKSEFFYYQHLNPRDFVQIEPPPDGRYRWDWEKQYVETRPEFVRRTLRLSDRKRRQLEVFERIRTEDAYREMQWRRVYEFDVFLSFATANQPEAIRIQEMVASAGGKVFLSAKTLEPGDDFADVIRKALRGSRELWMLVTPDSLKSEWVMTEWGAAWVLEKRIVPILLRCSPAQLPHRLKGLQCVDLHDIERHIAHRFTGSSREPK
jgi:hypothetical protein